MSLVTCCTSCGTLFKVVADQLKISDGWVRCGQCATVFDAQSNLVLEQAAAPRQASKPPDEDADADQIIAPYLIAPHADLAEDKSILDTQNAPTPDQSPNAPFAESEPEPARTLEVKPEKQAEREPEEQAEPVPSFVAQAKRSARWHSPKMRLGLMLAAFALLAVLALQIVLHEKDRLAALQPAMKPLLEALCKPVGCQIEPFKQIEAVAVDASSFNRVNKNNASFEALVQSYQLVVSLKNIGGLTVALPHVELSLQDAQDQTILRRILSPADLGSRLRALAPAQDVAGSVLLQVDTAQLAGQRIAGYRVLAFYP